MPVNPYQKYQQQSVMTMTQGEMLTKLYNEIIKQFSGAAMYMREPEPNITEINRALQKGQRILNHLRATLDHQYKILAELDAFYDYFIRQAVQANLKKDPKLIEEVIPLVTELRDAFIQADRNARKH